MVKVRVRLILRLDPLFAEIRVLSESHLHCLVVFLIYVFERDSMLAHVSEVLLGLLIGASSQTFIILHLPFMHHVCVLLFRIYLPFVEVLLSEETQDFIALRRFYQWGHKAFHERVQM